MSMPMPTERGPIGALNMYSRRKGGFTEDDETTAQQFAVHAAVVLVNADAYWDARDLSERLDQAMQTRSVIEQAKGMLMAVQRCSADEAFELLVKASQRENVKLREIARRLVDNAANREGPVGPLE
jgi:GAF domain-containing protein